MASPSKDEQTSFRFLYMGAATALRNPRHHEFITDDPVSALEHPSGGSTPPVSVQRPAPDTGISGKNFPRTTGRPSTGEAQLEMPHTVSRLLTSDWKAESSLSSWLKPMLGSSSRFCWSAMTSSRPEAVSPIAPATTPLCAFC